MTSLRILSLSVLLALGMPEACAATRARAQAGRRRPASALEAWTAARPSGVKTFIDRYGVRP